MSNAAKPEVKQRLLGGFLALFVWGLALGETHDVTVVANAFNPNDLVIEPGDTVRWTYDPPRQCGPYGCSQAPRHTVTADDFSWTSGPPAEEFVYSRTFDTVGEILYHCEVHSEPGQDIDSNMNGRIVVAGEDPPPGFVVNAGLNDAWIQAGLFGQGFFFNVFPELGLFFLSWFTFDTVRSGEDIQAILGGAGQRWLTALGTWEGDTVTLDVELTSGGIFNQSEPMPDQQPEYGTITIVFHDCNNATLTYDFPALGLMGSIELTRVVTDNVQLCEELQSTGSE